MRRLNSPIRILAGLGASLAALGGAHLLLLLLASLRRGPDAPTVEHDELNRFAVVVPAHDEETQIAATLRSLTGLTYPADRRRVIVVADNCEDRTADVARELGAEVWERTDPDRRGKGHALAWALASIQQEGWADAVSVVDADCEVPANLLQAFDRRFADGASACQAGYAIADPETSQGAALRWAGFALFNRVRPLGRERLGLSCGLLGTGMAFSRTLLAEHPWRATSFAEDREQHMLWVLDGARVAFCDDATITSAASPTTAASDSQEARWESGRLKLARELCPRLLRRAVVRGDLVALDAALEPILPPQSMLISLASGALVLAWLSKARTARRLALGALVEQLVYVLAGLRATAAPPAVWRALLRAPSFILRRLRIFVALGSGDGPAGWIRTPRDEDRGTEPARAAGEVSVTAVAAPTGDSRPHASSEQLSATQGAENQLLEATIASDPRERDIAERAHASESLAGSAARGFAWVVGGRLGSQVAQFAASVALARILVPSAYGLVAVVLTFTSFAQLFNDLGLSAALVQKPTLTERDASTCFALNGASGVLLTVLILAIRHPLADLFNQPHLAPLLAIASLNFALSVTPVPYSILERRMQFGKLAAIDIGGSLIGLSITVGCAAAGVGAESLVIGPLANTVVMSIAGLICARWVPRAWPSARSARHMLGFGAHLTGFNVASFWARNTDTLLLARFAGSFDLGLYNRAYQLMLLPLGQIGGVLGRVLLPLFATMQDDLPRLRAAMIRVVRTTATLLFPALAGLAAISHNFVLVAYGARWRGATLLIVFLAISGMPQVFGIASAQVTQAVGQARLLSSWGIVWSLTAVAAIVCGLPWGAEGVAIALAVRGVVSVPIEMMPAKRAIGVGAWALLGAVWVPLVAAAVMAGCVVLVGGLLDGPLPIGVALAAQLLVAPVVYCAVIVTIDRTVLADTLILVRQRRLPDQSESVSPEPKAPDLGAFEPSGHENVTARLDIARARVADI